MHDSQPLDYFLKSKEKPLVYPSANQRKNLKALLQYSE